MKAKKIFPLLLLYLILSFRLQTSAQNWFPLEVGNKWQYFVEQVLSHTYDWEYYAPIAYIATDTVINNKTYYNINYSINDPEFLIHHTYRFDYNVNSLYYYDPYYNGDLLEMNFNLEAGDTVPGWFGREVVTGNDSLFNTLIYYKGWYEYMPYAFIDYIEEHYCQGIGLFFKQEIARVPGIGTYESYQNLIQAEINTEDSTIIYSHDYYPIINFLPVNSITDSNFSIQLNVDHYFSRNQVVYPGPVKSLFNFIKTVLVESYYSNGDTILIRSSDVAENVLNQKLYEFSTKVDIGLIRNGFNYYYRIKAIDKSMFPHISFAPDTGYYVAVYDTTTGVIDIGESPAPFDLYQNFPNPFNPTTTITYTIPTTPKSSPLTNGRTKEGFVKLKVYDILGNEVATLVNEEKPAGEYKVKFDGSNLPSGIYFYQLKAGNFIQTKKMILLR